MTQNTFFGFPADAEIQQNDRHMIYADRNGLARFVKRPVKEGSLELGFDFRQSGKNDDGDDDDD